MMWINDFVTASIVMTNPECTKTMQLSQQQLRKTFQIKLLSPFNGQQIHNYGG